MIAVLKSCRLSLKLLTIIFLTAAGSLAASAQTPQEKYIGQLARELIKISSSGANAETRRRPFHRVLNKYADLSRVQRVALGRYRRSLPNKHRPTYRKLVQDYVADTLVDYSDDFTNASLEVQKSRKSGKDVIVKTKINRSTVNWRVRGSGKNIRVTDVSFGGVWLSIGLRGQFTAVLNSKNGDFDALIKYLRANST